MHMCYWIGLSFNLELQQKNIIHGTRSFFIGKDMTLTLGLTVDLILNNIYIEYFLIPF